MRLPKPLWDAAKRRANERAIPYTRFLLLKQLSRWRVEVRLQDIEELLRKTEKVRQTGERTYDYLVVKAHMRLDIPCQHCALPFPCLPPRSYQASRQRELASPCMPAIRVLNTEPYGSVCSDQLRRLLRRALGRDPTRRSAAARACRRFDHGPCRELPHDPHGHQEACRRLGAGGASHHGEDRARRTCKLGPRRLEEEAAWIERYRQLWDARFDALDKVVEELKRKEKPMDARRESEVAPMKNRTTVERKSEREIVVTRTFNGPARIVFEAWTRPELFRQWWCRSRWNVPAFLRNGCSCRRQVPFRVRTRGLTDGVLRHVQGSNTALAPRLDE